MTYTARRAYSCYDGKDGKSMLSSDQHAVSHVNAVNICKLETYFKICIKTVLFISLRSFYCFLNLLKENKSNYNTIQY